ncbi:Cell cycle checkpoint protein RAD17 [Smittium mucronatum]|uniref:Cell cycle checkpoint protein RAD17 n=1 Tax=Smittium mucronatum TaxID=133383 RepID=A0A1R0H395_9FUNG|nr:Cell cycle checkpoint protein RAD17 [Smittium mucronatum]
MRATLYKSSQLLNNNLAKHLSNLQNGSADANSPSSIQLRISGNAEDSLKNISQCVGGDIRSALNNLQIIWPSIQISKLEYNSNTMEDVKLLNLNSFHMVSNLKNPASVSSPESDSKSPQRINGLLSPNLKFDFNKKKTSNSSIKNKIKSFESDFYVITGFSDFDISSEDSNNQNPHKNLSLFHALGKVLYSKRVPSTLFGASDKINPNELQDRGQLSSDASSILETLPVDKDIFSLYLHQNYPFFTDEITEYSDVSEYFSQCDLLSYTGKLYVSPANSY